MYVRISQIVVSTNKLQLYEKVCKCTGTGDRFIIILWFMSHLNVVSY